MYTLHVSYVYVWCSQFPVPVAVLFTTWQWSIRTVTHMRTCSILLQNKCTVMFIDDSLISHSVHAQIGTSSINVTNNLPFQSIPAESNSSPTVLQINLIYKQIWPCRCVIWGPNNNTQGVSFIITLRMAAPAHRKLASTQTLNVGCHAEGSD
jgi:hypothetical protein